MSTLPPPAPFAAEPELGPLECYEAAGRLGLAQALPLIACVLIVYLAEVPATLLDMIGELTQDESVIFALALASLLWSLLVTGPLHVGLAFASVKAVRGQDVQVADVFAGFRKWLRSVAAYFVYVLVVAVGLVLLIVPGVVFAVRFGFTLFLVVDADRTVGQALRESWELTRGRGFDLFLLALLAIPIVIAGLLALCVGVIPATAWVYVCWALAYDRVTSHAWSRYWAAQPAPSA